MFPPRFFGCLKITVDSSFSANIDIVIMHFGAGQSRVDLLVLILKIFVVCNKTDRSVVNVIKLNWSSSMKPF